MFYKLQMEFGLHSDQICKDIQTPGWASSKAILTLWSETDCISFTELHWESTEGRREVSIIYEEQGSSARGLILGIML